MTNPFPIRAQLSSVEKIGAGGSGIVYHARHPILGDVAVKVAISADPVILELFDYEYSVIRSLKHGGIVTLFDLGWTEDDLPFIVMEHLPRGDLYSHTDTQRAEKRFSNFAIFLAAVQHLHNLGIVHRDLKGENILLDSNGTPKVTDLGLARSAGDKSIRRSGTVEYMAPEVADNGDSLPQSDIYSIGVMLYRLATGKLPLVSDDPLQVISLKRHPERIDYSIIPPEIGPALTPVINKCLQLRPEDRYSSVAALAENLNNAGLIEETSDVTAPLGQYCHHYFYSYSTSFARQNFSQPRGEIEIVDSHQAKAASLITALSDYLKRRRFNIAEEGDNSACRLSTEADDFNIAIVPDRIKGQDTGKRIYFPVLDQQAFATILNNIFAAGIQQDVTDLLWHYSTGNIRLLQVLLTQFAEQSHVECRDNGIRLRPVENSEFEPCDDYYDVIAQMTPDMGDCAVAAMLLAVDKFGNQVEPLIKAGVVHLDQLVNLVEAGVLTRENYRFAASYMREHFYHLAEPEERYSFHRQWIDLLESEAFADVEDCDIQLFYHLARAGEIEEAARIAITISARCKEANTPEVARRVVKEALQLRDLSNYRDLELGLLVELGGLARGAGDLNHALRAYARVIRMAKPLGKLELVAIAYKNSGDIYKEKCDYWRGNQVLGKAVKLYGELGDELELSHCFNNIGNMHWLNGDLAEAEINYETALEVQKNLGAERDIASSMSNLGTIKFMRQKYDECIQLLRESMRIKRKLKDYGEVARTANNLSAVYFELGQLELAKEYLDESLSLNKSIGATKELLMNYDNLFEIEIRRSNRREAKEAVYDGLRLCDASDHSYRGRLLANLAEILTQEGLFNRAGVLLAVASRLEKQVTDKFFSMRINSVIVQYLLQLRDFQTAGYFLEQAIKLSDKLGEKKSRALLLLQKARILSNQFAEEESIEECYRKAEQIADNLAAPQLEFEILLERWQHSLSTGNLPAAEKASKMVENHSAFEGSDVYKLRRRFLNGQLCMMRENWRNAVDQLSEAEKLAELAPDPELSWRCQGMLTKCYQKQLEYEKALSSAMAAFGTIKKLASLISEAHLRTTYMADPEKERLAGQLQELTALVT